MLLDKKILTTIKGKILFGVISVIIIVNIIFTAFIASFLDNNFKKDIIKEMNGIKTISINTIKINEVMEEPIWKSLATIKESAEAYVSIANKEGKITQFTGEVIDEEDIKNIVKESKNISSIIKFKKMPGDYCITYNYPIYLEEDQLYGNLIIQKSYVDKYIEKIYTIGIIILGQVIVVVTISLVVTYIIKRTTKPLQILTNSMKSFSCGEEVPDMRINSNDEIADLSVTYNEMKRKIKKQIEIITEEKEKVEALQKSSREFFNNATHELKTPVTAISLYAQILRDNDIKEMDKDFLFRSMERITLECEKMKTLVEKLLEVSRGKSGIRKPFISFSLNEMTEELIEDLEVRINKRGLIVRKKLEKLTCYAVFEEIEQVILNLIDNSIKYSKGNTIYINGYSKNEFSILEISNKCNKFPEDIKERLMDPFVKYNNYKDVSKEVSSSGLGLYLCKELIKENNGFINYYIVDDKITFKVGIPK